MTERKGKGCVASTAGSSSSWITRGAFGGLATILAATVASAFTPPLASLSSSYSSSHLIHHSSQSRTLMHASSRQKDNNHYDKLELLDDTKHEAHQNHCFIETALQTGRHLMATATLAGVLLLSPELLDNAQSQYPFHLRPPEAYAESVLEMPVPAPMKQQQQQPQKKEEISVLDEVWALIGKYYIDRSFNGQVRLDSIIIVIIFIAVFIIILVLDWYAFLSLPCL